MKTETLILQDWDDLVFENRNRNYGAYIIRKSYSGNTVKAFGMGVMFVGALLFLPRLIYLLSGKQIPLLGAKPHGGIVLDNIPIVIPTMKKPAQKQRVMTPPTQDIMPVVTTKDVPVEPDVLLVDEPNDPGLTGTAGGEVVVQQGSLGEVGVVTESHPIVDFAEVTPQFPGGMEALSKFIRGKMKYPRSAKSLGIEGKVFVQFVVDYQGNVVDVHVVRGISSDCDKEAARVIGLMPSWKPGMQNNRPVSVRMVMPIGFRLNQ